MKAEIPTYEEFYEYFENALREKEDEPKNYTEWLKDKYEAWKEAGWKKEKSGKFYPIKIWKSTLRQCIPHRMPNKVKNIKVVTDPTPKRKSKLESIDDDRLISVWNTYSIMNKLNPDHVDCFDILLRRGVFKRGEEISERTGKPWQEWYNKLAEKALPFAVAYAMDNNYSREDRNAIRNGKHELAETFIKLEALYIYFKRFENEDRLKKAM